MKFTNKEYVIDNELDCCPKCGSLSLMRVSEELIKCSACDEEYNKQG